MEKRRFRTHRRPIGLMAATLCVVSVIMACAYLRVWSFANLRLYLHLSYHSPVAQALWRGEIRQGDRIDGVMAKSRPNHVISIGPFLRISYFPTGDLPPGSISLEGTTLTAKDGRLISAESYGCTFQRIYFDITTAEEKSLFKRLLDERFAAERRVANCPSELALQRSQHRSGDF